MQLMQLFSRFHSIHLAKLLPEILPEADLSKAADVTESTTSTLPETVLEFF